MPQNRRPIIKDTCPQRHQPFARILNLVAIGTAKFPNLRLRILAIAMRTVTATNPTHLPRRSNRVVRSRQVHKPLEHTIRTQIYYSVAIPRFIHFSSPHSPIISRTNSWLNKVKKMPCCHLRLGLIGIFRQVLGTPCRKASLQ